MGVHAKFGEEGEVQGALVVGVDGALCGVLRPAVDVKALFAAELRVALWLLARVQAGDVNMVLLPGVAQFTSLFTHHGHGLHLDLGAFCNLHFDLGD
jgi:hypothetical protein